MKNLLRTVLMSVVLPLALLGAAALGAKRLMDTGPTAARKPAERRALLVEVETVRARDVVARIEAMGVVIPAQTISLQPRVGGAVVEVSPKLAPGGLFAAGERILRIDPADFELAVKQRETDVARAKADLRLEEGLQSVARREYELLGQGLDRKDADLVLRGPQMQAVRARLSASEAALAQAKLDLARTAVTAPFNALLRARTADLGSHVSSSTTLATLVGTDAYWVEVAVPVDQLDWIRVPGATAVVFNVATRGPGGVRTGRVLRLLGDLEAEGRMARLIVEVDDPLGLRNTAPGIPPLLLDAYVRVEIEGRTLEDVVSVRRAHLRQGDRVWLMVDGRLAVRPVDIVYRGREDVVVRSGLREGDRLVTTDLSAPVEGMALRTGEPEGRELVAPQSGLGH